jgi:hypothetical protein
MRAPPVAAKQTNGTFCSRRVDAATKRSPTTEPIEPPMNSNSKQAAPPACSSPSPPITTSASVSPVASSASGEALGYFLLSLNFSGIDRHHLLADLEAALGVEQASSRARAPMRWWCVALRADVEVLLEVGLVEHRSQAGHLTHSPSGTERRSPDRSLDLGGQQLLEPTHGALLAWGHAASAAGEPASSAVRISPMKAPAGKRRPRSRGPFSMILDDTGCR